MRAMTRAVVCGVSGQDGAYLSSLLLEKGYAVFGTSRDAQMSSFDNLARLGIRERVQLISMVPTDFRSVIQVFLNVEPDEVYNLAGQSSVGLSFGQPVETLESIALGTLNILEAIRLLKRPVRFYNACSGECFGDTEGGPADEMTPFAPRSPYGVAKATSYWTVANYREAYGLSACSGLLFNHESPLRPERFVTRKIVRGAVEIAAGVRDVIPLGNLSVSRDWGWAPDYVDAMWRMLHGDGRRDYVIATGELHSLEEFVAAAFDGVGLDWRRHVVIDESLFRPADIQRSYGNASRAQELLGWTAGHRMNEVVQLMIDAERTALSPPSARA